VLENSSTQYGVHAEWFRKIANIQLTLVGLSQAQLKLQRDRLHRWAAKTKARSEPLRSMDERLASGPSEARAVLRTTRACSVAWQGPSTQRS
jgi:hypothetical protein